MIDVNDLYVRTSVLAKKSQAGWQSSIDFNSDLKASNLILYEFYVKEFEENQRILDGLRPFIKQVTLPLTQGTTSATTPLPTDYFHRLEVGVNKVTNQECGEQPLVQPFPADYLTTNETLYTLSSAIRKPSIKKGIYRHTFIGNILHIYPRECTSVIFKYLSRPATPFWGSTLVSNQNGDFEQYTPNPPTVQCDFAEQEFNNFCTLLLYFIGVETKDSPIVLFAKSVQQENLIR